MKPRVKQPVLFLSALLLASASGPGFSAEPVFTENYTGEAVISTDQACRLKAEFPKVETVQLLPFGNVQDLRGNLIIDCRAAVMRGSRGVPRAAFRPHFQVGMFNLSNGTTETFALHGPTVRTDREGYADFMASIPGDPIRSFAGSGEAEVLAQTITSLEFRNKKKSDHVTVSCNGGFGAGCAQQSCSVGSPCNLGDRDGDGNDEMCLGGTQCYKDGDVCNSKDNVLGECYTEFALSTITNPGRTCDCSCDT